MAGTTPWSVTFAASDTSKAVTFTGGVDLGTTSYGIFISKDQADFYGFYIDPATKTSTGFTLSLSDAPGASLTVNGFVLPR